MRQVTQFFVENHETNIITERKIRNQFAWSNRSDFGIFGKNQRKKKCGDNLQFFDGMCMRNSEIH